MTRRFTAVLSLKTVLKGGLLGFLLLGSALALAPAAALAGTCPAGQEGTDLRMPDSTPAKDVTDKVVASIDLAKEPAGIQDRQFRLRRLEVKPGGVVPWHSHQDRPAIIYVIKGEITEYSSTCAVPIVHKAGESTAERHGVAHWWKNTGKGTAVLLSADLLHVADPEPGMM
ncbi:cupin domain-containing protein (plasmid) [Skermanella mucosa]|uniref:cupin domain-containing protein n=1 Tax=Skermanella mucosa TaxID=1789672 RepID=UPI00192B0A00|nr:cupin domain-containing protein [Skermanella mucosa]UEM24655.1 cupin domain-containing protein [Skermanella mucosa]